MRRKDLYRKPHAEGKSDFFVRNSFLKTVRKSLMAVGGIWTSTEADIEVASCWHNSSGVWPQLRNEKLFYMEIFGNTHCGPVAGPRPTHAPSTVRLYPDSYFEWSLLKNKVKKVTFFVNLSTKTFMGSNKCSLGSCWKGAIIEPSDQTMVHLVVHTRRFCHNIKNLRHFFWYVLSRTRNQDEVTFSTRVFSSSCKFHSNGEYWGRCISKYKFNERYY